MLFNSYDYLIFFLPVTLLVYFRVGRRPVSAQIWLVLASLFFYGWWNPIHLPLLLGSIAFNFGVSQRLARANRSAAVLAAAIAANLIVLAIFKYADFLADTANALTGAALQGPHLTLPLGISFFTFTQIAYLVDTFHGRAREPSPENYGLFVSFFPHLLAGPIIHHSEMMPQFASRTNKSPQVENLSAGLFLLVVGLAKKVLLADQFAPIADGGFADPESLSILGAWSAVIAYTMQIYFDFSGYTDMALGAARMFNIRLPINFDSPYRSTSIREFWHRWHMTLSRFLRQYLYIPLGGNRKSETHTLANLIATFVLGGLWHGAAWTFVVWGLLHGVGVTCHRLWQRSNLRVPGPLAWAITFLFVMLTWTFFRARSLHDAAAVLGAMLGLGPASGVSKGDWLAWWTQIESVTHSASKLPPAISMLLLASGLSVVWLRRNSNAMAAEFRPTVMNGLFVTAILPLCVLQISKSLPFLYFNF
jgi:alginate O-acetyltransferase complex protein AlgI